MVNHTERREASGAWSTIQRAERLVVHGQPYREERG
jgi:hypothetical protein